MTSHGGRAVKSGRILEGIIRSTLEGTRAHGFEVMAVGGFRQAKQHAGLPDRYLIKDFPYRNDLSDEG